ARTARASHHVVGVDRQRGRSRRGCPSVRAQLAGAYRAQTKRRAAKLSSRSSFRPLGGVVYATIEFNRRRKSRSGDRAPVALDGGVCLEDVDPRGRQCGVPGSGGVQIEEVPADLIDPYFAGPEIEV